MNIDEATVDITAIITYVKVEDSTYCILRNATCYNVWISLRNIILTEDTVSQATRDALEHALEETL